MKLFLSASNDEINEIVNIVSDVTNEHEKSKEVLLKSHESIWKNDDGSDYMKISYKYFNSDEYGNNSAFVDINIPEEITLKTLKVIAKISNVIYSIMNLITNYGNEIESLLKTKKHDKETTNE